MQAPAPKDLLINTTGERFLLTWTVALPDSQSRWLSNLEYEVVFKRLQDSWEVRTMASSAPKPRDPVQPEPAPLTSLSPQEASTLYLNSSQAILESEHLIPGSTYVARVRTHLAPSSGLSGRPSQWSPEVRWHSQTGSMVKVGAAPF